MSDTDQGLRDDMREAFTHAFIEEQRRVFDDELRELVSAPLASDVPSCVVRVAALRCAGGAMLQCAAELLSLTLDAPASAETLVLQIYELMESIVSRAEATWQAKEAVWQRLKDLDKSRRGT